MRLTDLPTGTHATIIGVSSDTPQTDGVTLERLVELGFIPGEPLQLLRQVHPPALPSLPQRAARAGGGGCDCSGCDKVVGVTPSSTQVVQFHPRRSSAK